MESGRKEKENERKEEKKVSGEKITSHFLLFSREESRVGLEVEENINCCENWNDIFTCSSVYIFSLP